MTIEEWKKGWKELWIRFNTSPKLYQKGDFGLLLQLLKHAWDWSSSSKPVEIETEGKGNVVTDIAVKEDNVLTVTKGEIEPGGGGGKTYFPDYACWQKPMAKKGAQVLWSPTDLCVANNIVGYKCPISSPFSVWDPLGHLSGDMWLEIGSMSNNVVEYEEGPRFNNIELHTLQKRLIELLEKQVIELDTDIPIKLGMFNKIHPEEDGAIVQLAWQGGSEIDYQGDLVFEFSVEQLINWDKEILYLEGLDERSGEELKKKLDGILSAKNIRIYTPLKVYFADFLNNIEEDPTYKYKKCFYILQYFSRTDTWQIKKIKQNIVRVKYHTTEYYLNNGIVERNNYREYQQLSVQATDAHLQLNPDTLIKLISNNGKRHTRLLLCGNINGDYRSQDDDTYEQDIIQVPVHRIYFLNKINPYDGYKYGGYVIISGDTNQLSCGHHPYKGKLFQFRHHYRFLTWRRKYRVFYKSQIPLYRVYLHASDEDTSMLLGNLTRCQFVKYIMPKIAY